MPEPSEYEVLRRVGAANLQSALSPDQPPGLRSPHRNGRRGLCRFHSSYNAYPQFTSLGVSGHSHAGEEISRIIGGYKDAVRAKLERLAPSLIVRRREQHNDWYDKSPSTLLPQAANRLDSIDPLKLEVEQKQVRPFDLQ